MKLMTGPATIAAAALCALAGGAVRAQSLAERAAAVRDGELRLAFEARPGVCGNGRGLIADIPGRWNHNTDASGGRHWRRECEEGPVRVRLTMRGGAVTAARTYVAGHWGPADDGTVDLGEVPPREAAEFLLAAARRASPRAGADLILPATLADAETWPALLRIARDDALVSALRRAAASHLGTAAAAAAGLDSLATDEDEDDEVRKAALYAIAQRGEEGVPTLVRVARTSRRVALRRDAIYYLSQSGDPRALDLFEELLLGRR